MTELPTRERCKQALTRWAKEDRFLGQVDQRPDLDGCLTRLAGVLAEYEQGLRANFARAIDAVRANLTERADSLRGVRATLAERLIPLQSADRLDTATLKQIADALDEQVRLLSRRVRPRLLRALEHASPSRIIAAKLLEELRALLATALDSMPEEITLVVARNGGAETVTGKSLFDLACLTRLDELCEKRLLKYLRLRRLRSRLKHDYRLLALPLKEMATEAMLLHTDLIAADLSARHQAIHDELQTQLVDTWRGVRYGLDTAVAELEELHDQSVTLEKDTIAARAQELAAMALAVFDQIFQTFDEVAARYARHFDDVVAEITDDHKNAIQAIARGVDQANSWRGRLGWNIKSHEKALRRRWERTHQYLNQRFAGARKRSTRILERGQRVWQSSKTALGVARNEEEAQLEFTDLPPATELAERAHALPPVYRRLFSNDPLLNREFLVGQKEELETLDEALGRWQAGRAASVAIVGPHGSGKTSLLNCFEGELDADIAVLRIDLNERLHSAQDVIALIKQAFDIKEPCRTIEELLVQLRAAPRRIVIVEPGHQLMLRAVGGREAPETFFYIVMATRAHLLWLVSFRLYPWTRLDYLFDTSRYFTHVVRTTFHDRHELREALLLRQRVSRQALVFAQAPKPSVRVRRLHEAHALESPPVQEALANEYFQNLFEVSGGNMKAALFYWLQSLRHEPPDRIVVAPCLKLDDRFIKQLDRDYLFVLAELLSHGTLTAAEHGEIFRLQPLRSRLLLGYLHQIRLIEVQGGDGEAQYGINPVFHEPVSKLLHDMNILY